MNAVGGWGSTLVLRFGGFRGALDSAKELVRRFGAWTSIRAASLAPESVIVRTPCCSLAARLSTDSAHGPAAMDRRGDGGVSALSGVAARGVRTRPGGSASSSWGFVVGGSGWRCRSRWVRRGRRARLGDVGWPLALQVSSRGGCWHLAGPGAWPRFRPHPQRRSRAPLRVLLMRVSARGCRRALGSRAVGGRASGGERAQVLVLGAASSASSHWWLAACPGGASRAGKAQGLSARRGVPGVQGKAGSRVLFVGVQRLFDELSARCFRLLATGVLTSVLICTSTSSRLGARGIPASRCSRRCSWRSDECSLQCSRRVSIPVLTSVVVGFSTCLCPGVNVNSTARCSVTMFWAA